MRLTKRQSKILAGCTVVTFFVVATLYGGSGSEEVSIPEGTDLPALSNVSVEEEPSTSELDQAQVPESVDDATESTETSNFSLQDFHRSEVRDGKTIWEVRGSNAKYFPEQNSVHIEHGNLLFFNEKDDVIKLTAKRAVLYLEGAGVKKAEAFDGVKLVYNSDVTINTKEATYFIDQNLVKAPGFVTIESDALYIQGEQLEADVASKEAKLHKNVESTVKPKGKRK